MLNAMVTRVPCRSPKHTNVGPSPIPLDRKEEAMQFIEMDETVTLSAQLKTNEGPVILINKFNVAPEDAEQLVKAWSADAEFFKRQPGFISAQLHRGIGGSGVFLNYAIWESTEQFKKAFNSHQFKSNLDAYPSNTLVSPHLFKKMAVSGICLG
jgi:heme-degrading monooxygenase HmoA